MRATPWAARIRIDACHTEAGSCPLVGRYTIAGRYPGGACPFVGYAAAGTGYPGVDEAAGSAGYPASGGRATTLRRCPYLVAAAPPAAATAPRAELQPAEKISDQEIRSRIDDAISKLSCEHRAVIVMREIDGLEYLEIAEQMGCSVGTVMSRLFYARKKLQSLLKDVYDSI